MTSQIPRGTPSEEPREPLAASRGRWFRPALWVQYAILLRIPLLAFALLLFLGVLGFRGPRTITNLILVPGPRHLAAVSLMAVLFATHTGILTLLVCRLAPQRFGVKPLPRPRFFREPTAYSGLAFSVLALPLLVCFAYRNAVEGPDLGFGAPLAVLVGCAAAVLLALAIRWLRRRFFRDVGRWRLFRRVARALGPGYYDAERQRVEHGHSLAVAMVTLLGVLYAVGYWVLHPVTGSRNHLPTLAYGLAWLLLVVSVLAGVTFLLDRFRFPLLLGLILASVVLQAPSEINHAFRLRHLEGPPPPLPKAALLERLALSKELYPDRPRVLTVVTASGGGILAAAWTTRVLTGLQEEIGDPFTASVQLISAASGGSVGSYFFLRGFDPGYPAPPAHRLEAIREASRRSGLEDLAWGLLYPDFLRAVSPLGNPLFDRAWALERSWLRAAEDVGLPGATDLKEGPWLGEWMAGAREGWLPGFIFNATVVEDGHQLQISNLDLSDVAPPSPFFQLEEPAEPAGHTLDRRFPCAAPAEIPAVSAARLSATFPFITPVARALGEPGLECPQLPGWHIADGGYFDNFGVVGALGWLEALDRRQALEGFDRILWLQVLPFPDSCPPVHGPAPEPPRTATMEDPSAALRPPGVGGWLYSAVAPILTLIRMRDSTQTWRNDLEINLLAGRFGDRLQTVRLRPPANCDGDPDERDDLPLSWHLSAEDIERLDEAWASDPLQDAIETVAAVFQKTP